ncbi:MAG: GGDEF domain-containing protein [Chlamydiota bacterium]|nr:GGDEF domain-containing protein [Chlamydiota bacterium]
MTISMARHISFRDRIRMFCDININEGEAKTLWFSVLRHQKMLESQLCRPVDMMVAALDFLKEKTGSFRELLLVEKNKFLKTYAGAYHDPLTGLYNRRYLMENLSKEIDKARRYRMSFSLLFIDLDHFKSINDNFGHIIGDEVLQKSADLISRICRTSDLIARYGGEEFVVLMPQTSSKIALKVGERLRQAFDEEKYSLNDVIGKGPTISGGVVSCPQDGLDAKDLLHRSDQALYFAKKSGRNRIYLYRDIEPCLYEKRQQKAG